MNAATRTGKIIRWMVTDHWLFGRSKGLLRVRLNLVEDVIFLGIVLGARYYNPAVTHNMGRWVIICLVALITAWVVGGQARKHLGVERFNKDSTGSTG